MNNIIVKIALTIILDLNLVITQLWGKRKRSRLAQLSITCAVVHDGLARIKKFRQSKYKKLQMNNIIVKIALTIILDLNLVILLLNCQLLAAVVHDGCILHVSNHFLFPMLHVDRINCELQSYASFVITCEN